MPQREFAEEFKWLEELAREVDAFGGFYKKEDAAAIFCPNCETVQAYCTGCGKILVEVYDEATASCQNCGISLVHCSICGHPVEMLDDVPHQLQEPEYWKYCPACGEAVFATTDKCPHCKISMGGHLDRIYEETYHRVNDTVLQEEMILRVGRKSKYGRNRQTSLITMITKIKLCPSCRFAMVSQAEICERCGSSQEDTSVTKSQSKPVNHQPNRLQQFVLWLYRISKT
jgi:hypothetical protein